MKAAMFAGAVALVVGTVAGLGAGAYASRAWAPAPVVKVATREAESQTHAVDVLAHILRQGAAEGASSAQAPSASPSEAQGIEPELSPEAASKRWRERFAARIAEVRAEPRDREWATSTEGAFRRDFEQQAQAFRARLVELECRSTSCMGRVEWPSYGDAMQKFTDIPHHNYSTNCAVSIEVGERPSDAAQPHQATVIFNCKQS